MPRDTTRRATSPMTTRPRCSRQVSSPPRPACSLPTIPRFVPISMWRQASNQSICSRLTCSFASRPMPSFPSIPSSPMPRAAPTMGVPSPRLPMSRNSHSWGASPLLSLAPISTTTVRHREASVQAFHWDGTSKTTDS